jgi:hypothetical protein
VEALTSAGTNGGSLAITNASTAIMNAMVTGVSRRNVVHTLNGGATPNAKVFEFDWVAPSTNIGDVTFYFAGVAANGDGNDAVGDYVYAGQQVVTPALSTGISARSADVDVNVFPNPASDMLQVTHTMADAGLVEITLLDLNGRIVEKFVSAQRRPGRHTELIDGLDKHAAGTYALRVEQAGRTVQRPVMLQR